MTLLPLRLGKKHHAASDPISALRFAKDSVPYKLYLWNRTLSAYHEITLLDVRVCRKWPRRRRSTAFSRRMLYLLHHPITTMTSSSTTTEKTAERRQLRDVAGNLVYRDKDDNRVFLSHIAEYTSWDETKMFWTFPLFLWRVSRLPYQWIEHNVWTAPDPTIIVPSGKKNPLYWPKYEDEPRPEPE